MSIMDIMNTSTILSTSTIMSMACTGSWHS